MTYRRVQVLVDYALPSESATKTAVRDDLTPEQTAELAEDTVTRRHGPWSKSDMLLAAIIDRLGWVVYAAYHSQGGKPNKPQPYPRPGIGDSAARAVNPIAVARLEERRRQHREARVAAGLDDGQSAPVVRLDPKTAAVLAARKAAKAERQQRG